MSSRRHDPSAATRRTGAPATGRRRVILLFGLFASAIALVLIYPWGRGVSCSGLPVGQEGDAGGDSGAVFDKLPESLSRDQVREALSAVAPLVARCGRAGPEGDVVRVHLTISGHTGAVTEATVAKQYAGTEVATCATKMVELARFPRFSKKTLTVAYPFRLGASPQPDGGSSPQPSVEALSPGPAGDGG